MPHLVNPLKSYKPCPLIRFIAVRSKNQPIFQPVLGKTRGRAKERKRVLDLLIALGNWKGGIERLPLSDPQFGCMTLVTLVCEPIPCPPRVDGAQIAEFRSASLPFNISYDLFIIKIIHPYI